MKIGNGQMNKPLPKKPSYTDQHAAAQFFSVFVPNHLLTHPLLLT